MNNPAIPNSTASSDRQANITFFEVTTPIALAITVIAST